jgi:hypothetical protein
MFFNVLFLLLFKHGVQKQGGLAMHLQSRYQAGTRTAPQFSAGMGERCIVKIPP